MNSITLAAILRAVLQPALPVAEPPAAATATQATAHEPINRLEAQLLLLHALGRPLHDRAWLLANDTDSLPPDAAIRFAQLCQRRASGEPVAYLVGEKEFYGLVLRVDARVLVPRPDTETLVDWALRILVAVSSPSVLDLGTGSGAIALALQHARPDAQVFALDASADALAVAGINAERLNLPVRFLRGSWLHQYSGQHHLIASNPPYIAAHDPHLAALLHEPLAALVSGADGLDDIRQIVAQAPLHLHPGGWLLLEHGWNQADTVCKLLIDRGFESVQSAHDLAGTARCSGGVWAAGGQQ